MGTRVLPEDLLAMKQRGEPIAMLTCYDCPTARFQDGVGVDVVFVGDSVGVNVLGYESPREVTMDDIVHHTRIVRRGVQRALLLSDLPYRSYQTPAQAVENARRLKEAGADAVKLEGGEHVAPQVSAVAQAGIPIVGHVGHTPQTFEDHGRTRKVYGDRVEEAQDVLDGALALQAAGALAVVVECVPERVAEIVTDKLAIPTVGIGAGRGCDGQVLVMSDLLGMNDLRWRFIKRYADIGGQMSEAFAKYVEEVKTRQFPAKEHGYRIKAEELAKIKQLNGPSAH